MNLDPEAVRQAVRAALREDLGAEGDRTTERIIDVSESATARIVAKEDLVLAGVPVAREVFRQLDPELGWSGREDGGRIEPGGEIARIEGPARPILAGERAALNFLQRLSGIATMTRRAVDEVSGTSTVILDTRKTTPGLRHLEKYAVSVGGGSNHRMGLFDAVLIKDNHVALAGGIDEAVARAISAGVPPGEIEVEADDLEGVRMALAAGAGRILLDNFEPEEAAEAVAMAGGRARIEVSGGLVPGRLRPYAEAGADFLSLGCLTHSARSMDISLELERTD